MEGGWKMDFLNGQMQCVVMNANFWQSLIKGCGLIKDEDRYYCGNTECEAYKKSDWVLRGFCRNCGKEQIQFTYKSNVWVTYAKNFHEINLTEGWDKAIEYLEDLIK